MKLNARPKNSQQKLNLNFNGIKTYHTPNKLYINDASYKGSHKKKVPPLMARPLRPYPPPTPRT